MVKPGRQNHLGGQFALCLVLNETPDWMIFFLSDKLILRIKNTIQIRLAASSSQWKFWLELTEKEINKLLLETMVFC